MKKLLFVFLFTLSTLTGFAGNGDSIFNQTTIHNLYITFPYSTFYDSLLQSHATDIYLNVNIQFNSKILNSVGIKAKGNSSFNGPSQKKSFKLDMNEFVSGQDLHGLKKLNFNNSFKDPSFLREKLMNDFLIDHQLPAPRTTFCNVYMNNQLWGLYVIVEEVDDEFCDHWFGSNDGNLFKGDPRGDLTWKGGTAQGLYDTLYELKNNETANDWSDLIGLIDVINNTPNTQLPQVLDAQLNTGRFMKQWAAMNIFSSLDSYIGSGHNYYLYHDTITNKFEFIAWDNNEAFGSFKNNLNSTQLKQLDMYYLRTPVTGRPLCNNMLQNSTYKEMYNQAYCNLLYDFTNTYFDSKIDSLRNAIQQSVYNDPKKMYSNTKFDSSFNYDVTLTGPGGIVVFGLKSFIAERASFLQQHLITQGVVCWPLATPVVEEAQPLIYPNPAHQELYIQYVKPIQRVVLSDVFGRVLHSSTTKMVATQHLPNGIYAIQVNYAKPIMVVVRH
jgi:spore coat protein CotH